MEFSRNFPLNSCAIAFVLIVAAAAVVVVAVAAVMAVIVVDLYLAFYCSPTMLYTKITVHSYK